MYVCLPFDDGKTFCDIAGEIAWEGLEPAADAATKIAQLLVSHDYCWCERRGCCVFEEGADGIKRGGGRDGLLG